jgi:formylglycine-generating enzyme
MQESCCESPPIAGGTFYRSYHCSDTATLSDSATVNDFHLDKYQITVGRFRAFVNAGMGTQVNPPGAGAGAHPLISGSGWDPQWNTNLPKDTDKLKAAVACHPSYQTWTDVPGDHESYPQNCLDWDLAFAFCAWDGGRLPTEAEWGYAAAGGSEQRCYPWSTPPRPDVIDDSYALTCAPQCTGQSMEVGSKSPKGDARWGQSDMVGSLYDWTLDWYADAFPTPCDNCARLAQDPEHPGAQVVRGGYDAMGVSRSHERSLGPTVDMLTGARCARSGP